MKARRDFRHRASVAIILCLLAVPFVGAAADSETVSAPALSDYLAQAALNNPGLEAAFNRWKAALEKVAQVKTLPDPRFTYGYFIENVETRVGPQEQRFSLTQMFPWFGTLRLRGEVALQAADAAQAQYEAEKRALFYRVKESFYELYYLGRTISTTEDNIALLKHMESVAQAGYRAGGPQSAVIKAQVELGKLDDRLRSLNDMRGPLAARFNAALGRAADTPAPLPTTAPAGRLETSEEEILAAFADRNPELRNLDFLEAREEKSIALARKASYPSFVLGVDYVQTGEAMMPNTPDSGKDPVMAMVALDLPVWRGKYRAEVREAARRRDAAAELRDDRKNILAAGLKMALYRFRDAERKVDLFGNALIPQAKQSLSVTEEAYQAGKADFQSLIDAQRLLLEFQLARERAGADREIALAEIERVAGASAEPSVPGKEQP